jgi:cellulose biosynthesis protein BcsQ
VKKSTPVTNEEKPTEETKVPLGRIITFYSYKGGTGRSMAMSNVAWILASSEQRVLMIDWDLEAPGLHRYFRPFLPDPELAETPGLIDFFAEFVEGSRQQALAEPVPATPNAEAEPWFESYTDILSFAFSLDYKFTGGGTLDLVPAGRQGPSYASLVGTFNWGEFYEKMGGGVFLQSVKRRLRAAYDYVLIDSRTGLSDTSGICTVQMPDDLVVCFTLNRQSIWGAAATAESALRLRQKPSGSPGLRVWPVPTRIDNTEKEKLEVVRTMARESFSRHLWHLKRSERTAYWGQIEIFYVPYYAYLEVLAVAGDRSGHTGTVLFCMEQLTGWITGGNITRLEKMDERSRFALLERFSGAKEEGRRDALGGARIYLSYVQDDFREHPARELFEEIRGALEGHRVFWDDEMLLGSNVEDLLSEEMSKADIVVFFFGERAVKSRGVTREIQSAIRQHKQVVPVLFADETTWKSVPKALTSSRGLELSESRWSEGVERLVVGLRRLAARVRPQIIDVEDPQRGRWGGSSKQAGRELVATVREESEDWFSVDLRVRPENDVPLRGTVEFHLHDTFDPDVERVSARNGEAKLHLYAAGAFTVGALLEDGTTLELDLATLPDAPKVFRER